ncbi:MAG: Mrp/NBP35 family ATP-binding protein, partial [Acidobacteria bacterium]|nr:Mrp/NBP35 family ATP-binding protein [Acidobacteriota bacterium]
LVIDLPPGTGDVQLSLVQTTPLSGAVIVTTPSEVSLEDARKAVKMFEQVRVKVLGMVENMSYMLGPGGEHIDVFGQGGGRRTAEAMGIPFLGELPLDPQVRIGGDSGRPAALDPMGKGAAFHELARGVAGALAASANSGPKITLAD